MPFTKTPSNDTYSTKGVSFPTELDNRTGNVDKDIDLLNCFFDTSPDKGAVRAFKRAGLLPYLSIGSTNVRGVYYWEDMSRIIVAVGNGLQIYNSDNSGILATISGIFGTTTGEVGFTEFLYDTNTVKVVITDGTTLGTLDFALTWTAGTDPDMPVPHLPQPLFLDGYLFLVKSGTADIYNSNLNDPLMYTAGDFISCEMFPDTVLRFAKLNNYLVAMGSASIEYFWDAANDTGSPLQRNDTPVKLVGYLGGFAQSGNRIFFVGSTSTSTPEVYVLEDFKIDSVSDETVRRYLASLTTGIITNYGNIVSFMGHDFYTMNVGSLTYALDLKAKKWGRFAYQQNGNFACECAVSIKSNTTYTSAVFMNGTTQLLKFSDSTYQDNGVTFTTRFVSTNDDYDTYNRKFCSKLVIKADRTSVDSNISVSVSDDDYQTWSTARIVNLNQQLPSLDRMGYFRKRAHKFEFTDNQPLRVYGIDLNINMGQA